MSNLFCTHSGYGATLKENDIYDNKPEIPKLSPISTSTIWANSADDILTMFFFSKFSRRVGLDISCSLSVKDTLQGTSGLVLWVWRSGKKVTNVSVENSALLANSLI